MLYRTLTIDQLMQLNRRQLELALRIFQQELDGTIALLSQEEAAKQDEATLDDLSNLLTLRKVFRLRLQEMTVEQNHQSYHPRQAGSPGPRGPACPRGCPLPLLIA